MKDLKNAIIYQILIDRFSGFKSKVNSRDFVGGNLKGIVTKLDYLADLGINTLWLSPFYQTHQYHGYHITDFRKIDPHFGTPDDLRELIDQAHKKKMKVIADFVPNHCSVYHPFFQEAQKQKESKYYRWFYFKKWPDNYLCFLDYKEIPKINLDFPEAREYMTETAKYWLSSGIDGLRIDHVIGPSHDFWQYFYKKIKSIFPKAFLFGEVWAQGIKFRHYKTLEFRHKLKRMLFGISQEKLQQEYCEVMDGLLDFKLQGMIVKAVKRGKSISGNRQLKKQIGRHISKYPEDFKLVQFLDNHDMDRFMRHCKGDNAILLEALKLLSELNYPLVIYYDTENGVYNKEPVNVNVPFSDLNVREPFDWDKRNEILYNKIKRLFNQTG